MQEDNRRYSIRTVLTLAEIIKKVKVVIYKSIGIYYRERCIGLNNRIGKK